MKFFPTLLLALLGLCLLFTSCNSQSRLSGITLTVVSLRPVEGARPEARAIMTIRFDNESLAAVAISDSSHKLYFNGTRVGKAVSTAPIGLAPVSTITQEVTVTFENAALLAQLLAQRDQPAVAYRLESLLRATNGPVDLRALQNAAR